MPFPFEKIGRKIQKNEPPDKLGEEGVLHLIESDNNNYYAKQWYAIAEKRIGAPLESGFSPASPYWHKLKFFEYSLIHRMFPENTIAMVASIGPGISSKGEFTHDKGRPITITREVAGDTQLVKKRDSIIDPTYQKMHAYHEQTDHGWKATADERATFYRIVSETDEKIRKLFGKELKISKFDPNRPLESLPILIEEAQSINPDSVIFKFLQCGIVPIHPEFNFIPEEPTTRNLPPHGTFIELTIIDPKRFFEKASEEGKMDKKTAIAFNKYALYLQLDMMYDRIRLPTVGVSNTS